MEMPPPGWYEDPAGSTGLLRWWDGSQWTARTAAVPSGGPSAGPGGGLSAPPAFGAPSATPTSGHDPGGAVQPSPGGQVPRGTGDDPSLTDWFESIPVPVLSREEAASHPAGAARPADAVHPGQAATAPPGPALPAREAPARAGGWSPVSTGDQIPVPATGWSPAPAGGQAAVPADWSPVSTGDQIPVPATGWSPAPTEDEAPTRADDWSPVSTGDQIPVPATGWSPAPAGGQAAVPADWSPAPTEDEAPTRADDWSPVSTGDQIPVPATGWSPAPTGGQAPARAPAPAPASENSTRMLEVNGPAWNEDNAPWNQGGADWGDQSRGVVARRDWPPGPPKPAARDWSQRWDAALAWANQNRNRVMWGLGLGTAVAVLAVGGLVALLSSAAPAPATPDTGASHPAAASKVSPRPPASATGAPSTTPATGTPVTDSSSGLSYAMLGTPWQAGCPTLLNNATFTWTAGESAVAGTVGTGVNSAWYASACSGLLGSQYSYTGVADLENTAASLVGAFDPAYYNGLPHARTTVENDPLQVSGHPAWVMKFLMTYPTAAAQGLAWRTELGAVVVVDRGAGQAPGVFYVTVPDNLGTGNVDAELQSLQMAAPPATTAPAATTPPASAPASPPASGGPNP